jgi:hypothetical protein
VTAYRAIHIPCSFSAGLAGSLRCHQGLCFLWPSAIASASCTGPTAPVSTAPVSGAGLNRCLPLRRHSLSPLPLLALPLAPSLWGVLGVCALGSTHSMGFRPGSAFVPPVVPSLHGCWLRVGYLGVLGVAALGGFVFSAVADLGLYAAGGGFCLPGCFPAWVFPRRTSHRPPPPFLPPPPPPLALLGPQGWGPPPGGPLVCCLLGLWCLLGLRCLLCGPRCLLWCLSVTTPVRVPVPAPIPLWGGILRPGALRWLHCHRLGRLLSLVLG